MQNQEQERDKPTEDFVPRIRSQSQRKRRRTTNYEDEDTTDDEEDIEEEGPELPVKDINLEKYEEKIGGRKRKRRKAKKFEDEDDKNDKEEFDEDSLEDEHMEKDEEEMGRM